MAKRLTLLTVLDVFTPRTWRQVVMCVVFWLTTFSLVYLGLLWAFGRLDTAPLWEHVLLACIQCAPFLAVCVAVVRQHVALWGKFRRLSEHDTLTNLPNRRAFFNQANAKNVRDVPCLVVLIDIDHFKKVNDTYGHAVGDECLKSVAEFLQGWLGPDDLICRYGGEEFAVILHNTKAKAALAVAQTVAQGHRFSVGDRRISVTFSMGLADWPAGGELMEAIEKADKALYEAKAQGRERALIYGLGGLHDLGLAPSAAPMKRQG